MENRTVRDTIVHNNNETQTANKQETKQDKKRTNEKTRHNQKKRENDQSINKGRSSDSITEKSVFKEAKR